MGLVGRRERFIVGLEHLQRKGLRQGSYPKERRCAVLGDAGGKQDMEVAAALQLRIVGLQVFQLVGVVDHEQARPGQVSHGGEQFLYALWYVERQEAFLFCQAKGGGQGEYRVGQVAVAGHPCDVGVFLFISVKVPRREGGLAKAALPVEEQHVAARRKKVVVDAEQVVFASEEDLG